MTVAGYEKQDRPQGKKKKKQTKNIRQTEKWYLISFFWADFMKCGVDVLWGPVLFTQRVKNSSGDEIWELSRMHKDVDADGMDKHTHKEYTT